MDTDLIKHDWTSDKKPEIYQSVVHSCIEGQLVTKNAFSTGANTTFLNEIMSMCQISGWMNESIGAYTCTRPCGPPTNYSEMFEFDWSENEGSGDEGSGDGGSEDDEPVLVSIGTKVK